MEDVLQETLNSIVSSSQMPDEVIIVDDGSTDRTSQIGKEFADRNGWRLISTANKGLGHARNVGAREATKTYLMFLDADDTIAPNLIKDFREANNGNTGLDLFAFSIRAFDSNTNQTIPDRSHFYSKKYAGKGSAVLAELLLNNDFHSSAAAMIIRKNVINWQRQGFFRIVHEDEEFTPRAFWIAEHVIASPIAYYNYRQGRQQSIMNTRGKKKWMQSRIGYFTSLLSCIYLYLQTFSSPEANLALRRRIRYLSYHTFYPIYTAIKRHRPWN